MFTYLLNVRVSLRVTCHLFDGRRSVEGLVVHIVRSAVDEVRIKVDHDDSTIFSLSRDRFVHGCKDQCD